MEVEKKNNLKNKKGKNIKKEHKKQSKNILGIILILLLSISIILVTLIFFINKCDKEKKETKEIEVSSNVKEENNVLEVVIPKEEIKEITDWRLTLVNRENPLPEDFTIELANIDRTRKIDKRIIGELKEMMQAMKSAGINNIWVQSAYRSIEYQENLYNNKVNEYLKYGVTKEEAEKLTSEYINKPGESEHNLGLAVDFNKVNDDFKNTKAFKWLSQNAKDYGFVMRYPEEKAWITGIEYEPWHWRYVGKENAYKMEELDMCLEEYREYLETN